MDDGKRLYRGRVVRVPTYNSVEVEIDLTLGVFVRKTAVLEGLSDTLVGRRWSDAMHCLVVLCGGKTVYLSIDPSRRDGHLLARVFVPQWSPFVQADAPPPDMDGPALEVLPAMRWAATVDFDAKQLRTAIKG